MSPDSQFSRTVELIDVSKRYGNRFTVKSVSLSVAETECAAVLGPNGAGKTTLLKIIAAHTVPSEGTVKIYGEDISRKGSLLRKKIGLLTHDSFLYDELTVLENLQFYAQFFYTKRRHTPLDLIDFLELKRWYNVPVRELSYGLRKRADLGRVFIHNPDIVLLDEPFTGLDAAACELLVRHLREQKEAGKTILISSHSGEWLRKICDREVHLGKGRITGNHPAGDEGSR